MFTEHELLEKCDSKMALDVCCKGIGILIVS